MNEIYEKICKEVNWGKGKDTNELKLQLMNNYTLEQAEEAEGYAVGLLVQLREAGIETTLCKINGYYGDSVHDCMCELVAHGENFVTQVLHNPDIAFTMFNNNEYHENFFYIFPDEESYEMLTKEYYWAEVHKIQNMLHNVIDGTDISVVTSFDANGNVIPCTADHQQIKFVSELLDEIWLLKWNSSRDYDTIYKKTHSLGHGAWIANLWSDMGRYYAKVYPECVIGDGKFRKTPND